jgi:hypothetical protein
MEFSFWLERGQPCPRLEFGHFGVRLDEAVPSPGGSFDNSPAVHCRE